MVRSFISLVLIISSLMFPPTSAPTRPSAMSAPLPPPTSTPSFGLNSHLITRYPDPNGMDVPAQAVADLQVGWVREDFHWHRIQPNPQTYDWTFSDAAMRALLSRNVQVLGVLGPSVGWATPQANDSDNDVSFYPPDPQAFAIYARAVVQRYRRYVHHWEIWNEPDVKHFWQPTPDPVAYVKLLELTSSTIRSVDPSAKILIGGMNPFDTSFLRAVAAAGAWDSFDIIAIHPYVDPWTPEDGNLLAVTDGVRAVAGQYGAKPIWATEVGWSSGPSDRDPVGRSNEQTQANYLVRSLLLLWQAGVERSFWYTLKDDPGNPYGLFEYGNGRSDFSHPKPAYIAFKTLNLQLRGATYTSQRTLFSPSTIMDFEQPTEWLRTSQPNGSFAPSEEQAHSGTISARLDYRFSNPTNDYVVFERTTPLPIAGQPYGIGMWVYGDGNGHSLKVWLRDAEGEMLQYNLGTVGQAGWQFLSKPLGGLIEPGNVVTPGGNGQLDFPVSFAAIVLDDEPDSFIGSGTIYVDDLTITTGREAYDMRLQRDNAALDILWSPPSTRVVINTTATDANVVARDGDESTLPAKNGRLHLSLGPSPIYVWHSR